MLALETELAALEEAGSEAPGLPLAADFTEIRLSSVEFAFPAPAGEPGLAVGPFDLTIRRGRDHLRHGGNGSGQVDVFSSC